ncbi:putative ABC-type maltose transporter [Helianthus annuus]|nr:putative ABC-type maltose transporter [Helianthus annuus]
MISKLSKLPPLVEILLKTPIEKRFFLQLLGLDICINTMVGDQMIRGISGGQKKRVTTGEMIVGPSKVLLMDEISTGLDSSTTYQIVNSLKQFLHILEGTDVISLLQRAPETYDLFDDIILLTDGKIVYQGPRENVLKFFESMGFKCPERKGVADFLQEVTSKKDQEQYWMRRDEPYRFVVPGLRTGSQLGTKLGLVVKFGPCSFFFFFFFFVKWFFTLFEC